MPRNPSQTKKPEHLARYQEEVQTLIKLAGKQLDEWKAHLLATLPPELADEIKAIKLVLCAPGMKDANDKDTISVVYDVPDSLVAKMSTIPAVKAAFEGGVIVEEKPGAVRLP